MLSSSSPTEQPFLRLARVTHPFEKAQAYLPGREDASDRGVPRRVVVDPLLWIGRIRPILPRKAAQTFQLKGTGGSDVRAHSMCIDVVPGTCVGGSAMPLMRHRWLTWGQNVGAPSAPACFRACGPLCGPSACGTLQFCKRPASLQGISQCPRPESNQRTRFRSLANPQVCGNPSRSRGSARQQMRQGGAQKPVHIPKKSHGSPALLVTAAKEE